MYLKQHGIEAELHESVEQIGKESWIQPRKGIRRMVKMALQVNGWNNWQDIWENERKPCPYPKINSRWQAYLYTLRTEESMRECFNGPGDEKAYLGMMKPRSQRENID